MKLRCYICKRVLRCSELCSRDGQPIGVLIRAVRYFFRWLKELN